MNRRELVLTGLTGLGTLGVLSPLSALAADKKGGKAEASGPNPHQKAIDTAYDCLKKGEACIAHCQDLMAKGDTSLANCLKASLDMVAMCRAFATLATNQSKSLKKVAAACAEICRDCEKACREHEGHHRICKECAESCAACAKECEKIAA